MSKMIIDCNNLCYISFYALPDLSTYDKPTAIIYGFLSSLLNLQQTYNPEMMIFCWDSKKSYRKVVYPTYKAKRKDKSPEEIENLKIAFEQFTELRKQILPTLGFTNIYMKTGFEADDLIGYITKKYNETNFQIISTDQDLFQLLTPYVLLTNPITKTGLTKSLFKRLYKIEPEDWIMVKSLAGCNSDDINGIEGVGEKTAIKFIRNELPKTYKSYKSITSKEGQKIKRVNKRLVTLPFASTNKINIDLKEQPKMKEKIWHGIFYELGFGSFLDNMEQWIEEFNLERQNKWKKRKR